MVTFAAAEPLRSLTVNKSQVGQLNVNWTPGLRTGPTSYTVTWAEESSIGSGLYNTGYDNTTISGTCYCY